jgi:hypothetical protein
VGSRYLFPYFNASDRKRMINEWARTRETCLRWGFPDVPASVAFASKAGAGLLKEGFKFQPKLD